MTEELKKLKEASRFFDEFVNAALKNETAAFSPLEVVQNYNIVKDALAKLLVDKE